MSIDTEAPQSRRAVILGALGALVAAAIATVKPPTARAGDGDNLVLGTTSTATSSTTLTAGTANPALQVTGGAVGIGAAGAIGIDAAGDVAVNAVSDASPGAGVAGWSRASSQGVIGRSTDGSVADPPTSPKTGVYGIAEQDADARGVYGKSTAGQGVRGVATTGIGVAAVSTSGPAIDARSDESAGVIGVGPLGSVPDPLVVKPGVYGAAGSHPGVFGYSAFGHGVRGAATTADGVFGHTNASPDGTDPHPAHGLGASPGAGVHGHGGQAGVLGTNSGGFGVQAVSDSVPALYALNTSAVNAAIVAEGGPGTAIHGHANEGGTNQVLIPASPALTGVFGSALDTGVAIAAESASGLAVRAQSSLGHAIRGRGQLDGVIGESASGRSGVVGYSGSGSAPAGPAKTGVYGEATQDTTSRGVSGFTLAGQGVRGDATAGQGVAGVATTGDGVLGQAVGGRGVRGVATTGQGVAGEATTGIGVKAVATTGVALDVAGRAMFSRSGKASIPINKDYVDITVPGGLTGSPLVYATIQYKRTGVWIIGARPNWPSAGKIRIYTNKVASTTVTTPVAWFVLG